MKLWEPKPRQDSAAIDVGHALYASGQQIRQGATLIGDGGTGDWTCYVVRDTERIPLSFAVPGSVYERATLGFDLQVGHVRVGIDALLGLSPGDPAAAAGQQFDRGIALHVVGSECKVRVTGSGAASALAYPRSDYVRAWVAPGRPSEAYVPGVGYIVQSDAAAIEDAPIGTLYSVPWVPVPTFATALRAVCPDPTGIFVAGTLPANLYALYADWRGGLTVVPIRVGTLTAGTDVANLPLVNEPSQRTPVPLGARYVALVTSATFVEGATILPTTIEWTLYQ